MKNRIIEDSLPYIRQGVREFEGYSFSSELSARMKERSLSSVALANRAGVSHAAVDKWLKNQAVPNGKERLKELGMGLGMDTEELNAFLYRNGYPRLYVKNPLDSVALRLLKSGRGRHDLVSIYRELLQKTGLKRFVPTVETPEQRTSFMLSALSHLDEKDLAQWFSENRRNFVADAKTVYPDKHIADYLRLYIGDETANNLAATAELPSLLQPVLTALLNAKSVTLRGLSEKLIALGLYLNMTEEEINVLLEFFRLRPLTEPGTKLEQAVLLSVREAHGQYALYESENLERALKRLKASAQPYEKLLCADYEERYALARDLAEYYLHSELSEEELEFRELYTSYGDRGLMDYVADMLSALAAEGELEPGEVDDFLENIRRNEEEDK